MFVGGGQGSRRSAGFVERDNGNGERTPRVVLHPPDHANEVDEGAARLPRAFVKELSEQIGRSIQGGAAEISCIVDSILLRFVAVF